MSGLRGGWCPEWTDSRAEPRAWPVRGGAGHPFTHTPTSGPGEANGKDDNRHPRGPGAQARLALQAGVKQCARRGSGSHQAENHLTSIPTPGTALGQGDCAHGGCVAAAAHVGGTWSEGAGAGDTQGVPLPGGQAASLRPVSAWSPPKLGEGQSLCWPRHWDAACVNHRRCFLDVGGGVFCRLSPCVTLCVCVWAFMGTWVSWHLWSKAYAVVKQMGTSACVPTCPCICTPMCTAVRGGVCVHLCTPVSGNRYPASIGLSAMWAHTPWCVAMRAGGTVWCLVQLLWI